MFCIGAAHVFRNSAATTNPIWKIDSQRSLKGLISVIYLHPCRGVRPPVPACRGTGSDPVFPVYNRLIWRALAKTNRSSRRIATSSAGLAESSPGRPSWVTTPAETSPEGTTKNAPGCESGPHENAESKYRKPTPICSSFARVRITRTPSPIS
jgi:hypothetical protein